MQKLHHFICAITCVVKLSHTEIIIGSPINLSKKKTRGATTAEKLRGVGKVWVPTPGRLRPAPGHRPGWMLGAGGGRSLSL